MAGLPMRSGNGRKYNLIFILGIVKLLTNPFCRKGIPDFHVGEGGNNSDGEGLLRL